MVARYLVGEGVLLAYWYDRQGPVVEMLRVGEASGPAAGQGEVCVRSALPFCGCCSTTSPCG